MEEVGFPPNAFYEAGTILIPRTDKDTQNEKLTGYVLTEDRYKIPQRNTIKQN